MERGGRISKIGGSCIVITGSDFDASTTVARPAGFITIMDDINHNAGRIGRNGRGADVPGRVARRGAVREIITGGIRVVVDRANCRGIPIARTGIKTGGVPR